MMALLTLFVVSYFGIFAAAFQSRNVNGGHYLMAACGSFGIGLTQAFIWKAVTPANAGLAVALTYSVGGACGSLTAMWLHQRIFKEKKVG